MNHYDKDDYREPPPKPLWEQEKEKREFAKQQELEKMLQEFRERQKPNTDKEQVHHPEHYNLHPSGIETIEIIEHMDFLLGNVIKYVMRAEHKGNKKQDLEKALWYLTRAVNKEN